MTASDRRHASDRGFLLVAVLWIVSALAALASIYAAYVANTAVAIAVHDEAIRADGLVSASAELVAYRLLSAPAEQRPTHGTFDFRLGRANVAVDFRTEAARIDLNAAPKELLAGLFVVLGCQANEAQQYADRIVGWHSKPTSASQDPEASLYGAAGLDYGPRGGPFAHVGELSLVLGIPPAMVERAMPYVTVFSGQADVDLLEAAPEVLAALPRMTPDRMNAAMAERGAAANATGGADPNGGAATLRRVATTGSKAVRLTARVKFDTGQRIVSEAVILVDGSGDEPFRVLSWQENLDEPPGGLRVTETGR